MEKRSFICVHVLVDETIKNTGGNNINITTYLRNIMATSEAEAIGKMYQETSVVKCTNRLQVECYELSKLAKID